MLVRYEIVEKISTGTLPVEIVRYGIPEPAGVLVAKSASGDQKGHCHGHSKNDGERERETLEIKKLSFVVYFHSIPGFSKNRWFFKENIKNEENKGGKHVFL